MSLKKRRIAFKNKGFGIALILFVIIQIVFVSCKTKEQTDEGIEPISNSSTPIVEYKTESLLGEGAFWNYKTKELYWVDIEGKQLHIYNPKTKQNKSFATPSRIGTVVPHNETEVIIALEDGIYKMDITTGAINILSDVEHDVKENRFNDGKCDPSGNLWVGSMHFSQSAPKANLYKIDTQGNSEKMLDNITISNGIVWTSDAKTMYYIDTPTGNIRAFDFDSTTNTITNEKIAVTVPTSLGFPDGMAIDEENMLWVGLWNGNAVARFNPSTGALMSKIEVPAHNVTSCAFGGDNLDVLYITTASIDMTEEEKKQYPLAGSIFKVNPGVKGVKSAFFGVQNN